MAVIDRHTVSETTARTRLLDYLPGVFPSLPSRASIKKALKRKEILVDGAIAFQVSHIEGGQLIELLESTVPLPAVFELDLEVICEDDFLAVISKPPGIPVSGNTFQSIQNALLFNLKPSRASDALKLPRPVHRLDVPTSGLLLIAKTASVLMDLGMQFQQRGVKKKYHAVVNGKTPEEGTIENPVEGREAITKYRRVSKSRSLKHEWLTLLELQPETGRKHQLRVHLSGMGHPIVGDQTYASGQPLLRGKGLFLCATGLTFNHPVTGKTQTVRIDYPAKFDALLEREEQRWKKYR